jgi:hypothetical protein
MAFGFRGHRRVTGGQGIVQVNYTYDRAFDEVAAFPVSAKVGPREIAAYLSKIRRPVFHQRDRFSFFLCGGYDNELISARRDVIRENCKTGVSSK